MTYLLLHNYIYFFYKKERKKVAQHARHTHKPHTHARTRHTRACTESAHAGAATVLLPLEQVGDGACLIFLTQRCSVWKEIKQTLICTWQPGAYRLDWLSYLSCPNFLMAATCLGQTFDERATRELMRFHIFLQHVGSQNKKRESRVCLEGQRECTCVWNACQQLKPNFSNREREKGCTPCMLQPNLTERVRKRES
jgi:hypothetical protein